EGSSCSRPAHVHQRAHPQRPTQDGRRPAHERNQDREGITWPKTHPKLKNRRSRQPLRHPSQPNRRRLRPPPRLHSRKAKRRRKSSRRSTARTSFKASPTSRPHSTTLASQFPI